MLRIQVVKHLDLGNLKTPENCSCIQGLVVYSNYYCKLHMQIKR